jgi:predicted nuclease of predicted toxin-antitoxin system
VNILIDAQLPPALVRLLTDAGHQARHVTELGLREAPDPLVWDYAVRQRAVIFTKDEDFALRRLRAQSGPVVVWLRVGNCSTSALRKWLMPLLSQIDRMVAEGEALIEVR